MQGQQRDIAGHRSLVMSLPGQRRSSFRGKANAIGRDTWDTWDTLFQTRKKKGPEGSRRPRRSAKKRGEQRSLMSPVSRLSL